MTDWIDWLFGVDWANAFLPRTPVLEIILRGSAVYLSLFAMLRFVLKREAGAVGITDLLVVVLLADAAQNAMAGGYNSVPDGLILVATIIFWAWALNWIGYRMPRVQRFVHPAPLPLVRDGRLLRRNLQEELITEEELLSQLRLQGIEDLTNVKSAYIEGDGRISVIERETNHHRAPERPSS